MSTSKVSEEINDNRRRFFGRCGHDHTPGVHFTSSPRPYFLSRSRSCFRTHRVSEVRAHTLQ